MSAETFSPEDTKTSAKGEQLSFDPWALPEVSANDNPWVSAEEQETRKLRAERFEDDMKKSNPNMAKKAFAMLGIRKTQAPAPAVGLMDGADYYRGKGVDDLLASGHSLDAFPQAQYMDAIQTEAYAENELRSVKGGTEIAANNGNVSQIEAGLRADKETQRALQKSLKEAYFSIDNSVSRKVFEDDLAHGVYENIANGDYSVRIKDLAEQMRETRSRIANAEPLVKNATALGDAESATYETATAINRAQEAIAAVERNRG